MSQSSDQMELREDEIRKHYGAATEMLMRLNHAPHLGKPRLSLEAPEKSPDVAGRFPSRWRWPMPMPI